MDLKEEANQFLYRARKGVLSTFSARFEGFPFGSVAPFIVDHGGCPIILISTLAEHTKNIAANPRVSLLVLDEVEDLHANARLTLIGEAGIADKQDTALRARYLRYYPQAEQYFDMHDFSFYRIQVAHIRYIAGFGKMGWIERQADPTYSALAEQETGIIEHMNEDHAENLLAYCRHYKRLACRQASMIGIDAYGFDVRCMPDGQETATTLRFDFDTPIANAMDARNALVAMAQATRS